MNNIKNLSDQIKIKLDEFDEAQTRSKEQKEQEALEKSKLE